MECKFYCIFINATVSDTAWNKMLRDNSVTDIKIFIMMSGKFRKKPETYSHGKGDM
jgi:hypothetical protein